MSDMIRSVLTITGSKRALAAFKTKCAADAKGKRWFDMGILMPVPAEFKEIHTGGCTIGHHHYSVWRVVDGCNTSIPVKEQDRLVRKLGTTSAYNWCCIKYGTKSIARGLLIEHAAALTAEFDTAWDAPRIGIQNLSRLHPALEFELNYNIDDEPLCEAYKAGEQV